MKLRLSIRVKIFISFLVIFLVSFATLFFKTVQNLDGSLEEIIEAELESNLRYAWHEYFSVSELFRYSLLQTVTSPQVKGQISRRDMKSLEGLIVRCRKNLASADLLVIVDENGRILAGDGGDPPGQKFALTNLLTRALREREPVVATEVVPLEMLCREGQERLCTPSTPRIPQKKVLVQTVAVPIIDDDARIIGGIVAGALVNRDARLPLHARDIFGTAVEISIMQGAERIVSLGAESRDVIIAPHILKKLEEGLSYRGQANMGKAMFLTAFQPIPDSYGHTVGSLAVALSLDSYYKIRKSHIRNMAISSVIGVILSFALAWVAARQLTKPLRALGQSARRIGEGDLDQKVEVESSGELGELEEAFNRMTEALRQRDVTIRGQNEELRALNRELEDRVSARTLDLQREKSRLEKILTSMAEGLIVTDRENHIVLLNPSAQKLFETIPSRITGKPVELLCESEGFFLLLNYLRGMESRSAEVSMVEERVTACGKEMVFRVSPLVDTNGDYAGMVLAVRDISAEANMERMKAEFYTAVSHEFKTPLTSIKGSLELLLGCRQFDDPREKALMGICVRNTERLISLTGEILEIARIGSGNTLFVFERVRLAEVIDESLDEVKEARQARGVTVVNELDPALPAVYGDRGRIVKVFANLLSNAIGASPEGGTVEISSTRSGNYLQVTLTDHGTGTNRPAWISPADGEGMEGTGLGMAFCLEILREYHGRMEYQAGTDGGTVVIVTLPISEEP